MMTRRHLLAVLLIGALAVPAGPALADPARLTAAEIEALLTGKTIRGTWSGELYKQYFRADGSTIYAPRHGQSSLGKWLMNADTDSYESWWERSRWAAYGMIRDGDQLFWTDEGVDPQPFEVLPGEQLVWTE